MAILSEMRRGGRVLDGMLELDEVEVRFSVVELMVVEAVELKEEEVFSIEDWYELRGRTFEIIVSTLSTNRKTL